MIKLRGVQPLIYVYVKQKNKGARVQGVKGARCKGARVQGKKLKNLMQKNENKTHPPYQKQNDFLCDVCCVYYIITQSLYISNINFVSLFSKC